MVKGLERVRGNQNVFRLRQELHAWNIDGSSVNKPEVGSWIKFWEHSSGCTRTRCAYSDCPKQAEHGGHVWIKGHSSVSRGGSLAVITAYTYQMACTGRRIAMDYTYDDVDDGYVTDYYDFMSAELVDLTEDASGGWQPYSPRRRKCAACGADISNKPTNFTKCESCHYGGAEGAQRRSSGGWQQYSPRRRRCAVCGADISNKPTNFTKCESCHYGNLHLR